MEKYLDLLHGVSHMVQLLAVLVDGCPPNIVLYLRKIYKRDMDRRRPGNSKFVSQRKESDKIEILSGVFNGKQPAHQYQF